jgi:tetratricopeptide (TPR) repeat protein
MTTGCVNPVDIAVEREQTEFVTGSMSPLRAARLARGWSQVRAAEEIAALAVARGITVAAPVSLKTQLSRWENQHALPEEHYRALLCALYDATEADLGLTAEPIPDDPPESPIESLRNALNRAASVDGEAIALFRSQLDTVRRLDHRLGPSAAENSARSILSVVTDRWRHCTTRASRRALALLAADSALLCAEHSMDRIQDDQAWEHWETARCAAHDAEAQELAGYIGLRQASALVGIGEHQAAEELIAETGSISERRPLWPWLLATRGYAHAAQGDATASDEAFTQVERRLSTAVRVDAIEPGISILGYDMTAAHRDRGHALLLLGDHADAVTSLQRALADASGSARELAAVHVDLAYALTGLGLADEAAGHAGQARAIASRSGCLSAAARLDGRWTPESAASETPPEVRC